MLSTTSTNLAVRIGHGKITFPGGKDAETLPDTANYTANAAYDTQIGRWPDFQQMMQSSQFYENWSYGNFTTLYKNRYLTENYQLILNFTKANLLHF